METCYHDHNPNSLYLFFFFFVVILKNKEADTGCGENPAWRNTDKYPGDCSYFSTGVLNF